MRSYSPPAHTGFVPEASIAAPAGARDLIKPRGRAVWEMNTSLPFDEDRRDIVLRRESVYDPAVRSEIERIATNVPWRAIEGSPSGFEWGFRGSGPHDLALNILTLFVPPGSDGFEPIRLSEGSTSHLAWKLKCDFVDRFIAGLPRTGGEISGAAITDWINEHATKLETGFKGVRLPEYYSQSTASPIEKASFVSERSSVLQQVGIEDLKPVDIDGPRRNFQQAIADFLTARFAVARRDRGADGSTKDNFSKKLYDTAIGLARKLHAIDVELFRAEVRMGTPILAPLVDALPKELRGAVITLSDAYQRSTDTSRMIATSLPPSEMLKAIGVDPDLPVAISAFGPSLVIAARSREAFTALVKATISDPNEDSADVGAFKHRVKIGAVWQFYLALPHQENYFDQKSFGWMRDTLLHERQHTQTDIVQRKFLEPMPKGGQPVEKTEMQYQEYFLESLRSEIISRAVEGKFFTLRTGPKSAFGPNGLYDYPKRNSQWIREVIQQRHPGLSESEIDQSLQTISKKYHERAAQILNAVRGAFERFDGNDQGMPTLFRVLELFPTNSWPSHIRRLERLYPALTNETRW